MQEYIGKRLGAYQIVEQIGQGGMATVFKAYQPSMDRYVAVKILPSHFTEDESFMGRFTQEARTLARLEHPRILPVHDYGEQEGITYLVMRYVEAGTLKTLITQQGPLALEETARILGQVGGALDYAHSQGVIHRDIKPSNVLIDQQGNTFLTDFGIAKLVAETAQFTAQGAVIGTPAYMSPEQSTAKPADSRCDIYSLGVVLYEMVTGRVPFEAETPLAVLLKHVNDPLPLPRQIKPDLPPAVERVILKAMAKSPDDRFQSAGEMVKALEEAVAAPPAEHTLPAPPAAAVEATTLVYSGREPEPPPTPAPVAPAPPAGTTPPPAATATPLPGPATPPDMVAPTPGQAAVPEVAPPPARKRKTWLFIAGGAVLLCLCVAVGLYVGWELIDGEPAPAPVVEVLATPTAALGVQATPTAALGVQATPATASGADETPTTVPPPAVSEQVPYPPGWTSYTNGNFVFALAQQDGVLWAGGDGGLVRWDLTDGSYDKFGVEDGLASGRINDLLVDRDGVLWIATDAGINRYDGETLITFDEADGLDARQIEALFQDELGVLWAGSRGGEHGLNYYDGQSWGPSPLPLPVEYPTVQLIGGNEEDGYFAGLEDQGLAYFDGEEWILHTIADGLPGENILAALMTDDSLWVSSYEGMVRFQLDTGEPEDIPLEGILSMHQAADGSLWFGGDWRVMRYDPGTGDWQQFDSDTVPAVPSWVVFDIVEDEHGLWFGTYGAGLAFYDGSNWETWITDDKVGGNWIKAIRQDGDGTLWFAHEGSGLSRYEPGSDTWRSFGTAEGALDWPTYPAIDSDGYLWTGDYGELVYYDGQDWQSFRAPELEDVEIWGSDIGPGDVKWLATDTGLMRHDPATDEWTTFTSADHPIIGEMWVFLAASDGTLWVGGEEGIARYDGSTWSTPTALGDAPIFVDDLAEAPDGSLWIATYGELGHLADGRWSYFPWHSDGWLERVAVGPDGSVWAGYEGLGRFDPATGEWQMFSTADGLAHHIVQAIHVTPQGVVWIGTEGGISRYVPPR